MTQVDTRPGNRFAERDELVEDLTTYKYGWHDADDYSAAFERGLSEKVVRGISGLKGEPEWMLERRLKGLEQFERKPLPTWGCDLSQLHFDDIKYFVRAQDRPANDWNDLPEDIRNTYDRLGIPEAE